MVQCPDRLARCGGGGVREGGGRGDDISLALSDNDVFAIDPGGVVRAALQ